MTGRRITHWQAPDGTWVEWLEPDWQAMPEPREMTYQEQVAAGLRYVVALYGRNARWPGGVVPAPPGQPAASSGDECSRSTSGSGTEPR